MAKNWEIFEGHGLGNLEKCRSVTVRLEINVRSGSKLVEIWLTKAERRDGQFRKQLEALYQKNRKQGRLTVVYESGEQELLDMTSDLLCYNRKRMAQMEMEQGCGSNEGASFV